MKKSARFASLCLTALCLLSSCAGETDTAKENAASPEITGVYRRTEITLPEGYAPSYEAKPVYVGGQFYFRANYDNYVDIYKDFTVDPSGVLQEVTGASLADAEAVQEGHFVGTIWESGGGNIAFTEMHYTETESSLYFSSRDADGNVLFSVDIAGYMGYDLSHDDTFSVGIGFTVLDCLYVDDTILVLTSEGLCALQPNGTMRWKETSQREPSAIARTEIGVLYLSKTGGLRPVNMADGTLGEKIELSGEIAGGTEIYLGDGYDCYVFGDTALWGVNFSMADDGTVAAASEQVINWLNSDIVPSDISALTIAGADTMLANMRDMVTSGDQKLYLLTKVPEDEIEEKEIISLAQMEESWYLPYAVRIFNEESETYRVVITDYTQYEDVEQRNQKLNAEMAAGRVPDIIYFYPRSNMDTTVETYIRSGIFADLTPLLQADMTFNYDDLLGYVTKPYTSSDGAQYVFPLNPGSRIYIASPGTIGGVMTPDEALDRMDSLTGETWMTRSDYGYGRDILNAALDEYIDWENYTCSFDNGAFAGLIDRVKTIPRPIEFPYSTDGETLSAMREGKLLLCEYNFFTLSGWARVSHTLGGYPAAAGIPNNEGKLITGSAMSDYFTVTAASAYKSEAVELLEVLMELNQGGSTNRNYYKSDIDRRCEEYRELTFVQLPQGLTSVSDEKAAEMTGDKWKITEEDAEAYKAFLDDIDACLRYDTMIYEIASEEIWSDTSRTGEEIASVIQSRVSIYLSEISK